MKLTRVQIDEQNLEQLQHSIDTVEDALSRADSFGVCRIKQTATVSVLVSASSESHFEVGIVPLLLEARASIIERMQGFGIENLDSDRGSMLELIDKYKARWLITTGTVAWAIGTYLIWKTPHWSSLTTITTHESYTALSSLATIAFGGLLWVIIDKNTSRRNFALSSVVLAAILAAATLL